MTHSHYSTGFVIVACYFVLLFSYGYLLQNSPRFERAVTWIVGITMWDRELLPMPFQRIRRKLGRLSAQVGVGLISRSGLYQSYWSGWRGDQFAFAENAGLHILPVHYYTPIPTTRDFARARRANRLAGLSIDLDAGAKRAIDLIAKHTDGIANLLSESTGYERDNASFAPLDASILHGMISEIRPRRIIEIGSGMSTVVMLDAIRSCDTSTHLTCIEPYLPAYLTDRKKDIATVIETPLQDVAPELFEQLESGDILFIDSTHVVRYDSDVVYEILEILPRLRPGVIVHVHDIFLPNDYPARWLSEHRFFWNEQYMLQAFLSMNPNFVVDIPLHAASGEILAAHSFIPSTSAEVTSFWMRRV